MAWQTTTLLVLLGIVPSFIWIVFFRKEDDHPEPKRLIVYTFFAGVLVTFWVLFIQRFLFTVFQRVSIGEYSPLSLFLFALIEEVGKFAAAYTIVAFHKRDFEEPIDAMIYTITAALGLAAVENVALALRATDPLLAGGAALQVVGLRFFGATLLHGLASGLVGFAWGRAVFTGHNLFHALSMGVLVASLLHAFFNYLILMSDPVRWPLFLLIAISPAVFYDFSRLKHPLQL